MVIVSDWLVLDLGRGKRSDKTVSLGVSACRTHFSTGLETSLSSLSVFSCSLVKMLLPLSRMLLPLLRMLLPPSQASKASSSGSSATSRGSGSAWLQRVGESKSVAGRMGTGESLRSVKAIFSWTLWSRGTWCCGDVAGSTSWLSGDDLPEMMELGDIEGVVSSTLAKGTGSTWTWSEGALWKMKQKNQVNSKV